MWIPSTSDIEQRLKETTFESRASLGIESASSVSASFSGPNRNQADFVNALIELLDRSVEAHLKLQTVVALGEFTNLPGVLEALGNVVVADGPVDIRYAAFTSIQRAGPQPTGVDILAQLLDDETLGPSIRALLCEWHLT